MDKTDREEYKQTMFANHYADMTKHVKTGISVFLIASGLYSLYNAQFERKVRTKNMSYAIAAVSIGFGAWQLSKQLYNLQSVQNIQNEKLDDKDKL